MSSIFINWHAPIATAEEPESCIGQTTPAQTNWQPNGNYGRYVDVDTRSCGLPFTPQYVTSLGGNGSHWIVSGATGIY